MNDRAMERVPNHLRTHCLDNRPGTTDKSEITALTLRGPIRTFGLNQRERIQNWGHSPEELCRVGLPLADRSSAAGIDQNDRMILIEHVSNWSNRSHRSAVPSGVIKPIRKCHHHAPDPEGRNWPARSCGGGTGSNKYWEHGSLDVTGTCACRFSSQTPVDVLLENLETAADP